MARKSAPKPSKTAALFLADVRKRDPAPGCEPEWERYIAACQAQAEADAALDVVAALVEKEGGVSSSKHWPAFEKALLASQRTTKAVMGTLDAYLYREAHINDDKLVPEDELRAIVIDSISDKLDQLQFTINSGMLGSKIAQAMRSDVVEAEPVIPTFCSDCGA